MFDIDDAGGAHNRILNLLPKMSHGSIQMQWVRCNRPQCKCASGDLHGPYYYLFWRDHGRLRKRYIKASDVGGVQAALAEVQAQLNQAKSAVQTLQELGRQLREVVKHG